MFIGPWSGKFTHLHFPLIFKFQNPTFPASTLSYYRLRYFRKIRAFFGCSAYSMKSRHMPQLPVRLLYTGNSPPPPSLGTLAIPAEEPHGNKNEAKCLYASFRHALVFFCFVLFCFVIFLSVWERSPRVLVMQLFSL